MARQVRVTSEWTHAEAITEACRRLRVMHQKWPETAWRMRVRKVRMRESRRHFVWAIYALIPDERRDKVEVAEPCS